MRVRMAALNGYVDLAHSLGLDPHPLMRRAGIDAAEFATTEGWVDVHCVDELLELTSAAAGCDDLGIRMAEDRGIANLGPVGLVAREEPDLRSALNIVLRHIRLHNESIHVRLSEARGLATLRIDSAPGATLGHQSIALCVGSTCQILRDFFPDGWGPASCCLTRNAPTDLDAHERVLGPTVQFGHVFDGLVLYSRDLDTPNPLADPILRPFAREYLGLLARPTDTSTAGQVRELIETLLPTESCTVDRIARSLGMDRRTLHRRLARTNQSYSSILDAVRAEHAERAITQGAHRLSDVASELGFSGISAFSRWFRLRFGTSPRAWAAARRA